MILFDTNIFIYLFLGSRSAEEMFEKYQERAMSAISLIELYDGAQRSSDEEQKWVRKLSENVELIPIEENVSIYAGELMAEEREKGKKNPILTADLLIAATALTHNIPLLTANAKDFKKYKGLKIIKFK
jgi:tRNA(fMet)-specific endonuclease VapC